MIRHHPNDPRAALLQHRWLNRLQTGLLILTLVEIAAAAGSLLFGESGLWLALFAVAGTLLLEPAAASALTLRLYRARALHPHEAHEMWALLSELSARAGLPATPVPHYVPCRRQRLRHRLQAACIDRPHRWPAAQPEFARTGGCARARGRAHRQ
jgi:heat shock protein HtpX